jgi:hypothetical protein
MRATGTKHGQKAAGDEVKSLLHGSTVTVEQHDNKRPSPHDAAIVTPLTLLVIRLPSPVITSNLSYNTGTCSTQHIMILVPFQCNNIIISIIPVLIGGHSCS